jgi:NADH-quinone oxidoreductase subunit G
MPRRNDAVNETWMCDAGRLGYKYVNAEDRLRQPLVRRNGHLTTSDWNDALMTVAGILRDAARDAGQRVRIGVIASPHLTNEENFRFAQLVRMLGAEVAVAVRHGDSDDFLIKAEKAANARGARDMGLDGLRTPTQVLEAVADGRLPTLYACGSDILESDGRLAERALEKVERLIVQDVAPSKLTERADVIIPSLTFAEKSGTFTNSAGRVQQIHPAVERPAEQPCDGEIFARLLSLLGEGQWTFDPQRVLAEEIGQSIAAYRGLTFDAVGPLGVEVRAEAA